MLALVFVSQNNAGICPIVIGVPPSLVAMTYVNPFHSREAPQQHHPQAPRPQAPPDQGERAWTQPTTIIWTFSEN